MKALDIANKLFQRWKLKRFLEVAKKQTVRTAGFMRKHAIALLALCISVLGSLHMTSRFFVYYLYTPQLDVFVGGFNTTLSWSEVLQENGTVAGITVFNKDAQRDAWVEIEFKVSEPVRLRPQMESYFTERGFPTQNGFVFRTTVLHLPANGGGGPAFPFERYYKQISLRITVYPKMSMSEFGFPAYFGDIDLRTFEKNFTILP